MECKTPINDAAYTLAQITAADGWYFADNISDDNPLENRVFRFDEFSELWATAAPVVNSIHYTTTRIISGDTDRTITENHVATPGNVIRMVIRTTAFLGGNLLGGLYSRRGNYFSFGINIATDGNDNALPSSFTVGNEQYQTLQRIIGVL